MTLPPPPPDAPLSPGAGPSPSWQPPPGYRPPVPPGWQPPGYQMPPAGMVPPGPPKPPRRKPGCLGWLGIGVGGVIALIVIGALSAKYDGTDSGSSQTTSGN